MDGLFPLLARRVAATLSCFVIESERMSACDEVLRWSRELVLCTVESVTDPSW